MQRSLSRLFGFLLLAGIGCLLSFAPSAFNNPVAITPYLGGSFPDEDPSSLSGQYKMEIAFPNLTFNDVSAIASPANPDPGHATENMLFVGTVGGTIYAFDNQANVQTSQVITVLNHTTKVFARGENLAPTHPRDTWNHFLDGGLLNMVFHPEFGQAGSANANYVYLQYTGTEGGDNVVKVSRFTVAYNPLRLDPATEQLLITVPKRGPSHYGGGMCFDNQGFFYVAFGDGMDPPFNNQANRDYFFNTIQELNTFYGKILRIDLEMDPSRSHAPTVNLATAYGGSSGNLYWIPNDNPFNGQAGALEEIWTLGNRAPVRMTYDPVEDRIWEGEVGWNTREEVNIIEKGKNYQWPRFEGNLNNGQTFTNYNGSFPYGTEQAPTWDMVRPGGRYAIIGGYVYRGSALPALSGRYICGMFGSGEIYAMTLDPSTGLSTMDVIATKGGDKEIHTFGLDQQGEIYVGGNATDKLYKLVAQGQVSTPIPATLSATGAFSDLTNMTPAGGVLPYAPKNPFWSDGAEKYRWIALPNDGDHNLPSEEVGFSAEGNWTFPEGTVFIKHFEFETSPGVFTKIETRFMVQDKNQNYYGLSYRWRADQTDADLVDVNGATELLTTIFGQHIWTYPGRLTCMNCHNSSQGFVLGLNSYQLNGDYAYAPGQVENQLQKWNSLGMFDSDIGPDFSTYPVVPDWTDSTANLEDRARIYLDVNCAYCHNPNAGTPANFDASYLTLLEETGLIYESAGNSLGLPNPHIITPADTGRSVLYQRLHRVGVPEAMPPIAKDRREQGGADLIAAWIMSLDPDYRPDPLVPGLLVHLKLDENQGATAKDETSHEHDASLVNGPSWVAGQDSTGLQFDGQNDHLAISHTPVLALNNQLTLAAWVKVDNFGDWDGVITKGITNSPYALQLSGDGAVRFSANWGTPPNSTGGGSWNSPGQISAGTWQHITVTYDGQEIRFYLNGALDGTVNNPGLVFGDNAESLIMGVDFPGGDEYFDGAMDDVRVYNRALPAPLIELLYYGNRPPTALFTATPSGIDPLSYTFDATISSDPDGNALTYDWSLGDGGSSIEPLFSHQFPGHGTYSTRLIVHDGAYRDTLTQLITISCASPISYTPLVEIDPSGLPLGSLTSFTQSGSLGGDFTSSGGNPVVEEVGGKKAISFSGTEALISSFLSPTGISGAGSFTVVVEAWNPSLSGAESLVSWGHRGGPTGTNAQFMYGNNPAWGAIGHWGGPDMGFDGGVPSAGAWHTLAYTYEGGTNGLEKVYVDGILNAQENKTLNIHAGQPIQFGGARVSATGGLAELFSGSLGRIWVFDEELTLVEIQQLTQAACTDFVSLQAKVWLEGAYDGTEMRDDLRQNGLLTYQDPYTGSTSLVPGLMQQTGPTALVDWVQVELRSASDSAEVVATRSLLVRKDGQIVDTAGQTLIYFLGVPTGNYFVSVKHYHHLGAMTAQAIDLSGSPLLDFTDPALGLFAQGGTPMKSQGSTRLLWAGDANGDGTINAVDNVSHWRPENGQSYQYSINKADFNLDGVVNAVDINLYWLPNNSLTAQLP
ncbi:MAG: LamG-like jellyroll fold domain-containing protein [Bacteroidota bacterium]